MNLQPVKLCVSVLCVIAVFRTRWLWGAVSRIPWSAVYWDVCETGRERQPSVVSSAGSVVFNASVYGLRLSVFYDHK